MIFGTRCQISLALRALPLGQAKQMLGYPQEIIDSSHSTSTHFQVSLGRLGCRRGAIAFKEIVMKVDIRRDLTSATLTFRMIRKRFLGVLLVVFASTPIVQGQQINSTSGVNEQTMQALLRRIEQLEAADKELRDRVAQLEGAQHGSTQGSTPPSPAPIDTKETHRTIRGSVTPATAQVAVSPETPPPAQR